MTRTVAIIGNPNCGKTTLFNQLTGAEQKVGNWAGVTVSKKTGFYLHESQKIKVIDLPGVYSLSVPDVEQAIDEKIACRYILEREADVYINILDGTNLKRNLYLTLQLLEMQVPVIVVVNMLDIAKQRDIQIDLKALSRELGCRVVPMVSTKGQGITELKKAIQNHTLKFSHVQIPLAVSVTDAMHVLIESIKASAVHLNVPAKWLALRLLERDALVEAIVDNATLKKALTAGQQIELIEQEESDIVIADSRYVFIGQLCQQCVQQGNKSEKTITAAIDRVVMNRFLGIPIFLFTMYLMFELSMNIGTLLQPLFNISATTIFMDGVNYLGQLWHMPVWITIFFSQGIGLGINTVVNFIPQIGLLFLFLSLLEDSGYMARAAFVMDRFMQAVGLPGKSFIPLIVGFGCNVPAIMATRNLENRRDRILTALMTPFMSCGARLAIFVVFGAAFFPRHGGFMIFILYITGIVVAMLTGIIMKKTVLRGVTVPFILEMPAYHRPYAKNILLLTWQRLRGFVVRAGRYIIPICVIIGTLNAIQLDGTVKVGGSQNSVLAHVGRAIVPVLQPMGVENNNWPAAVGLITGVLAKEVVVGTLNTLYTQSNVSRDPIQHYSLWGGLESAVTTTVTGLSDAFSIAKMNPFTANESEHEMTETSMGHMVQAFPGAMAAFAYLLFVLLYVPCVSTVGALAREIGKGWAWFSTAWSLLIAYTVAVFFYQIATVMLHPLSSLSWLLGLLIFQASFIVMLRYSSEIGAKSKGISIC